MKTTYAMDAQHTLVVVISRRPRRFFTSHAQLEPNTLPPASSICMSSLSLLYYVEKSIDYPHSKRYPFVSWSSSSFQHLHCAILILGSKPASTPMVDSIGQGNLAHWPQWSNFFVSTHCLTSQIPPQNGLSIWIQPLQWTASLRSHWSQRTPHLDEYIMFISFHTLDACEKWKIREIVKLWCF